MAEYLEKIDQRIPDNKFTNKTKWKFGKCEKRFVLTSSISREIYLKLISLSDISSTILDFN